MYNEKKILVVDDDIELRQLLHDYLAKNGFQVLQAGDGTELFRLFPLQAVDLILLDIMLPGEDGFSLCQKIRQLSDVPIIMLTASSDETDSIVGLEMGADDYMAKPFNPRELLARIKAILRRTGSSDRQQEVVAAKRFFCFLNWVLDSTARKLVDDKGNEVTLSGADFALLMLFLERPQTILKRDEISDLTRGREASPFDRSIDVHISRLRHRLGDDGKNPQIIKTVRGVGYVLAVPVVQQDEVDF
ncbi:response regulator [Endozoicomonas sp. SM1973]|uniref:Response regulator n=1 Tax=Spartinivicinus marinus TaxID=2994442 RepID=A0A853IM70_9GAMM|nr:response regulator [Spartinivicinus marinus]MCX4027500.1 response regulator [Spartinivicinus marinus]NYZ68876.1 response regulator [Spartinivicinus marinus]